MKNQTLATRIRLAVLALLAAFVTVPGPAFAYEANIAPKDIVDAGGYCKGERCYLNGHAYHCVNGKCYAT